jgi:hypothetical protein
MPILVLTKEPLILPLRSSTPRVLGQTRAAPVVIAVLPLQPQHDLTSGPPPPKIPRASLGTLDATAALLLRNHALLL